MAVTPASRLSGNQEDDPHHLFSRDEAVAIKLNMLAGCLLEKKNETGPFISELNAKLTFYLAHFLLGAFSASNVSNNG